MIVLCMVVLAMGILGFNRFRDGHSRKGPSTNFLLGMSVVGMVAVSAHPPLVAAFSVPVRLWSQNAFY